MKASAFPWSCQGWTWLLLAGWFAGPVMPARAAPVRLGIVAEHPSLSRIGELLTADLSHRDDLALVERDQIRRLWKEQSLTATAAKDVIKLGQLLGANGLLILDLSERDTGTFMSARLVAVNPGVILDFSEYPFPLKDEELWRRVFAERLVPLLPKLDLLAKDAVPVSKLNFRSAVKTAAGEALERQINLLLVKRLMNQREVFVLEREKLETAVEEKYHTGLADSPFWNGSFLLEGTIDRTGYQTNAVSLSVRLTPPAPGRPLDFEVIGLRSELPGVVEKVATRILAALKTKTPALEWNAKDEANRYFEEAKWAARWGMLPEALAAADSAWALGQRDSNCAVMRVELSSKLATLVQPSYGRQEMYDPVRRRWFPLAPDPKSIGLAIRSLVAYQEFSDTLPASDPHPGSAWSTWGVRTLESASTVLQLFHFFPDSQFTAADKLGELREHARGVAAWLSRSEPVRDRYWRPRTVANDDVYNALYTPNILRCAVDYGCFWQDRPEDAIGLYRELMSSPLFFYIHAELCVREPQSPRLTAWTAEDRARVSSIWEGFLKELAASTNLHYRVEAQFLKLVDEPSEAVCKTIFKNLMTNLFETDPSIVTNSFPLLCMQWGAGRLGVAAGWDGMPHDKRTWLVRPWAERDRQLKTAQERVLFEAEKEYLRNNTPYQQFDFSRTFSLYHYSKDQATELKPLVATYKSNLLARAAADPASRGWTNSALQDLRALEYCVGLGLGLNPNQLASFEPAAVTPVQPWRPNSPDRPVAASGPKGSNATNRSPVTQASSQLAGWAPTAGTAFHALPEELLRAAGISSPVINAHRVAENKLWLDLRYGNRYEWRSAIAIWDPGSETWDVIVCPGKPETTQALGQPTFIGGEADSALYFQPFGGALYVSQWNEPLRRFDLKIRSWETLPIPVAKPTQLFAVHGRLYGASEETIFEIVDAGHGTRLLAGCRRRPVTSRLDSLHTFGDAMLLPGPGKTLRASICGSLFAWDGQDWREVFTLVGTRVQAVFPNGTILRSVDPASPGVWLLPNDRSQAEFCLGQESNDEPGRSRKRVTAGSSAVRRGLPQPTWQSSSRLLRDSVAIGTLNSNLYLVTTHVVHSNALAELVCLDRSFPRPLIVQIRLGEQFGAFLGETSRPFQLTTSTHLRPWIEFASGKLLLGHGRWTGVWSVPQLAVDAAVAAEKRRQVGNDNVKE